MDQISNAKKGGEARAEFLSPEKRREIAQKAISVRWSKTDEKKGIKRATHGSPDKPLHIGNIEIPCYVLTDETRVISERGVAGAFGSKRGGSHWRRLKKDPSGAYLPVYLSAHNLKPFIDDELAEALSKPIIFRTPSGSLAYGLEATLFPKLCDVFLREEMRRSSILLKKNLLLRLIF